MDPHTIAVCDYGVTSEGLFYYAMEYLDGITLAQLVRDDGPQPAGRVIAMLQQACCSLAEAHAAGLIHRDLKPENLMLCCRGGIPDMLKVLDFGLATVVTEHPERDQVSQCLSGTPLYMSPEAITAPQSIDARSDLYSLGAVAYLLLTGTDVFSGTSVTDILRQHIHAVPQPPSSRLDGRISPQLEAIILQCLAKDRASRPQSAQDLNRLLAGCPLDNSWNSQDAAIWWSQREAFKQTKVPDIPNALAATQLIVA